MALVLLLRLCRSCLNRCACDRRSASLRAHQWWHSAWHANAGKSDRRI